MTGAIIGIIGGIIIAYFTFIFGLKRFYREKQYENKLNRYLIITNEMKGFVEGADNKLSSESRTKFVDSYRTIWMYGNANVIRLVSKFLKIVLNPPSPKNIKQIKKIKYEAKKLLKKAIIEMRKDLNVNDKLNEEDFDIFI